MAEGIEQELFARGFFRGAEGDDPAVQLLPWEALYHPEFEFLARNPRFMLSRRLPSVTQSWPDIEKAIESLFK